MFTFWRFTIAFLSISSSLVIFVFLVKMSVYDITFSDTLPPKGINDIPPADTIIPSIFAKFPPPSSLPTTTESAAPTTSITPSTTPKTAPKTAPTTSTTPTAKSPKSLPTQSSQSLQSSLNFQVESTQQCFDYAKNCRDVQCAFQDFNVICDNKGNGPTCTCGTPGTGQTSDASSSIRSNAHFAILTIFISFIISFYQFC